jgi:hypothetical protein
MDQTNTPREREQERLVRAQGDAYEKSYDMLMSEDPHSQVAVDDYIVTASFEPAEGMYVMDADELRWQTPDAGQNQHLEVVIRDAHDGRFLPELAVRMTLTDTHGRVVTDVAVPFIWHPFVFHYGVDAGIPEEGDYVPRVFVEAPRFRRHDEVRGRRYARSVAAELAQVHLTPGVKAHGPE